MRTIIHKHPNIKSDSLVKEPKSVIVRDFNEESFKKFNTDFDDAYNTGQNIIPIVIDSYGGEVYSLLGMVSIIQSSKIPIATILMSKAMSCGAVLFSCGWKGMRYISKYSTIMIHDVLNYSYGKVEDIKSDAKETERLNEMIYEIMTTNCEQPKNFFKNIVYKKGHADWYITPKEAIKLNLANHIGVPTFNVNIKIKYELSL